MHFSKSIPGFSIREKNGDLMIDRNKFDPLFGRLYNSRIVIREGSRRDIPFFLRLYNATEIIRILKQAGLMLTQISGDWNGKPFGEDSKRMILIAGKTYL